MLSEKKIRLMTRMAIYEEKTGKEDLKLNRYYRMDYVRFQVVLTILSVTVALVILFIMGCVYNIEYILAEAVRMDYQAIGLQLLNVYIAVVGTYVLVAVLGYSIYYGTRRKKMRTYMKDMRHLQRMYEKNEA